MYRSKIVRSAWWSLQRYRPETGKLRKPDPCFNHGKLGKHGKTSSLGLFVRFAYFVVQVRLCRFGVVNSRAIYDTIASNYSKIGLSHLLQRSEFKRPRDTEGRLFFDASLFSPQSDSTKRHAY